MISVLSTVYSIDLSFHKLPFHIILKNGSDTMTRSKIYIIELRRDERTELRKTIRSKKTRKYFIMRGGFYEKNYFDRGDRRTWDRIG